VEENDRDLTWDILSRHPFGKTDRNNVKFQSR